MKKTIEKEEWKKVAKHASKVAKKQWAKFESRLTEESRKAISRVEAAAAVEAKRVTVSILKAVAEIDVNAKETIQTILNDLEKDGKNKRPAAAKKTGRSVKKVPSKKKAGKKLI